MSQEQDKNNKQKQRYQFLQRYRNNYVEFWSKENPTSNIFPKSENILKEFSPISISPKVIDYLSHELKTPLNAILIFSKLLLEKGESLDDKDLDKVKNILSSGKEILSLINDLVFFNQINTRQQKSLFLEQKDLYAFFKELEISKNFGTVAKFIFTPGNDLKWLTDYALLREIFVHMLKIFSILNFPDTIILYAEIKTGNFFIQNEQFGRVVVTKIVLPFMSAIAIMSVALFTAVLISKSSIASEDSLVISLLIPRNPSGLPAASNRGQTLILMNTVLPSFRLPVQFGKYFVP